MLDLYPDPYLPLLYLEMETTQFLILCLDEPDHTAFTSDPHFSSTYCTWLQKYLYCRSEIEVTESQLRWNFGPSAVPDRPVALDAAMRYHTAALHRLAAWCNGEPDPLLEVGAAYPSDDGLSDLDDDGDDEDSSGSEGGNNGEGGDSDWDEKPAEDTDTEPDSEASDDLAAPPEIHLADLPCCIQ
ncbi:hypothetical protein BOTBODRAFT_178810 [Botryobasidium botryosum FD-172 SS1]|uniref:Uncharacterized protein n=1 Tax=Botryobasidium botryosum (strain FD-172 SS1) TaxID=930990 RepID=A0A067M4W7_BOTB1|nr:hypothetical protein BOTBODRAFT_178810 [Botryobasidium botryosum FD-172 SS1]